MRLLKPILSFVMLLFLLPAWGQNLSNLRSRTIELTNDTIILDTLSIVPVSFNLKLNGAKLDSTQYQLEWYSGKLIVAQNLIGSSVEASYRVFPSLYSKQTFNKDPSLIMDIRNVPQNPFSYTVQPSTSDQLFDLGSLSRSGSISRGITIGNNQDLGVSSSLNLNLSGQITPKVGIRAAITDNNIPFQPEGNTQQLQDFDQIYIQLFTDETELTAGDFRLERPNSYFMSFFKRAQGVSIKHRFPIVKKKVNDEHPGFLEVKGSGALSRGKFRRQIIQGTEGNQGPYRLRGAENESFIIVIAGTERVYIDGQLLTRGQENDYIMDYNTAELSFTSKRLITKDSRIIIEFQYSERNYSRSLFHFGTDFEKNRLKVRFNLYSEQDGKNGLLNGDLSSDQLQLLQDIGDSVDLAIIPAIDSVGFDNDQVRYMKRDTTVNVAGNQVYFPEIYVFSIVPDSAIYQVRFSDVGVGFGDYNIDSEATANGRVYKWVAPDSITGTQKGRYVLVQKIITPKMNQLFTLGAEYKVAKNGTVAIEGALSNTDQNRFSSIDNDDNLGYGMKVKYDHVIPLDDSAKWAIKTGVDFEHLNENFRPIERFRTVEFERDWNIQNQTTFTNQYIAAARLGFTRKEMADVEYTFRSFVNETQFEAYQNALMVKVGHKGFNLDANGSHIFSNGKEINNRFGRFQVGTQQKFRWFWVGGTNIFEDNRFYLPNSDSLTSMSYRWNDAKVYIKSPDTWKNRYSVFYQRRDDWLPGDGQLKYSSLGESAGVTGELAKNPNSVFRATVTYRRLVIRDTLLSPNRPDNTLVSRLEYNLNVLKGALTSSTFYEVGSGLESTKEFSYIEVPPGQGAYSWIDQDGDDYKDINEYVLAVYQDTARYLRVFTPTNDFTKVYTTQFNEVININPRAAWGGKTGIRKFVSRFSDQLVYRIDRKTQRDNLLAAFDPFFSTVADSTLVTLTSSLRNTFFFNRSSSTIGADYTYAQTRSKVYLANGFETRSNVSHKLKVRWNFTKIFTLNADGEFGWKITDSFFDNNKLDVRYYVIEPQLVFQPGTKWRVRGKFKYTDKLNFKPENTGTEQAILRDAGVDGKYNLLQRGSINASFNFISITYAGTPGNSVEFELLEGLKAGLNFTWSVFFQMRVGKNMQVNLQYNGRKSGDNDAVHTGTVQVRAFF
ncbi:MAG: hypothetical protein K9G41_11440 [Flavobacteriales bacterium]|nr:hypothetical protein [Flavobacteriales bacterium]